MHSPQRVQETESSSNKSSREHSSELPLECPLQEFWAWVTHFFSGQRRQGLEPACPKWAAGPETLMKPKCLRMSQQMGKSPSTQIRQQTGILSASSHFTGSRKALSPLCQQVSRVEWGYHLVREGQRQKWCWSAGPTAPPCANRSQCKPMVENPLPRGSSGLPKTKFGLVQALKKRSPNVQEK